MGSDLIIDELWENHRTLTVPETVGKVASFVVYLLFAATFSASLVYYFFFQSTTASTEVSLLSMEDISGTMPNASKLEDGQSETRTRWTCKMINRYPLAPTSDKVTSREEVEEHDAKMKAWAADGSTGNPPEGPTRAGIFEGEWTPLLEHHLPGSTVIKQPFMDGLYGSGNAATPASSSTILAQFNTRFPATLAADLVQKHKESLKVTDVDFKSYCDLLKAKGYISDKEKNLCIEMFTKKFKGPSMGVDYYSSSTDMGKGYDIETFPDGSIGDSPNPTTGFHSPDDSPILRVTAIVPDLFLNGITLPAVTPGHQFPSTSYQECVELINSTVTVDNMDIKNGKKGSAGEDVIIRDLTGRNVETYDPCDGSIGPSNTYTICLYDEYCAPNTCGRDASQMMWPEYDQHGNVTGRRCNTVCNCNSNAGPCPKTRTHPMWYTNDHRCPYREYSQAAETECDDRSEILRGDLLNDDGSRPFITFPGSPLGMPFFFGDIGSRYDMYYDHLHTDIMFQEGQTKKYFRIIPPFNDEIVRSTFRHAGFPWNASEICEFYRHRGPYQCSHTQTVTTRYAS